MARRRKNTYTFARHIEEDYDFYEVVNEDHDWVESFCANIKDFHADIIPAVVKACTSCDGKSYPPFLDAFPHLDGVDGAEKAKKLMMPNNADSSSLAPNPWCVIEHIRRELTN